MNPKDMQKMMKRMGIQPQELDAIQVIIKLENNKELVVDNPSVVRVNFMGQDTLQISGSMEEREVEEEISESDIELIIEQTNCSRDTAIDALKRKKDLAEAILDIESSQEE